MCIPCTKISLSTRSSEGSQQLGLSRKYATTVKTKSFDEFCSEVHTAISNSTLAEMLLRDEKHVNTILLQYAKNQAEELCNLLSLYFSNSETAFKICWLLLKNTCVTRTSYTVIQNILELSDVDLNEERCHWISGEFTLFIERENPFLQAIFEGICESFQDLRQRLEQSHHKLIKKLKLVSFAKKLFPKSVELFREQSAQMNAAAKGSFVLKSHLETTRLLVARLRDEVEHSKNIMRICQSRKYEIYPLQEVVRLLKKNDCKFVQRLDEIEEQACLCLFNINRERNRLLQEIKIL